MRATGQNAAATAAPGIETGALARYLAGLVGGDVRIVAVRRLGEPGGEARDPKVFGYGVPLEVECAVNGVPQSLVVSRTRPAHGFGHDYPADRAWQALYAHTAYNGFPRHARSLDVGFVREGGELVSAGDATEFFQVVEKVEGAPYWRDLDRLLQAPLGDLDVARARALAGFLAGAHAVKHDAPALYERRIRELVGHGECLMGILDSYPHPCPLLPPDACADIERAAVGQRWRLRGRAHRLSRTHGDFHPWNLLFRAGTDFSVLDRSRGEWGEPADDVAALGINYLFYGLRRRESAGAAGPFRALFDEFLDAYLRASGDGELRETLPPFFAFRALVIAHPLWYPQLGDGLRRALIEFARRMMADALFDAGDVRALLGEPA